MDHISIRLSDGVTLAVPASLTSISTYVLLEQETWFEKECAFVARWLQPGMTVIDIGANIGVYSLPMAMRVAPGRVIAYEPASEPRLLLDMSRGLNQANNLEIVAAALSDGERQGHLVFGASSELNALGSAGPGEAVRITSLDREAAAQCWPSPDFVKIDAEGEEERILAGGSAFFDSHSPLVLFEIKAGAVINTKLRSAFMDIGYDCYRALAGEAILVRSDPRTPLDEYELNLFAAKPDRARCLAEDGYLVDPLPAWVPDTNSRSAALDALKERPFASGMTFDAVQEKDYRDGLAGYAQWRDRARPLMQRCGALAFAFTTLQALCARAPSAARLSTFARCASDFGRRAESVAALQQLLPIANQATRAPSEPFWPACARFDDIVPPPGQGQPWFLAMALEQFERSASYSSVFAGQSSYLPWLCAQPFAATEMERRRFLQGARAGQRIDVPPRLRNDAPDHLNAALWNQSKVIAAL